MTRHQGQLIPPPPPMPDALPFARDTPWLAPLAGYSDLAFRALCRSYGAACCTTEMVSARGLLYRSPGTFPLLVSDLPDTPLIVQLFGSTPSDLGAATGMLVEAGYRWFDLNCGCSVPKVLRQRAGCGMLADPANLLRCVEAMTAEAGKGHVGVKLRLGLTMEQPMPQDLPDELVRLGAGWLTLHPRTARQGFTGRADWTKIAELVEKTSVPVVASGDLLTAEDGLRCLAETGAATVMYARGALRSPCVFAAHAALLHGGTFSTLDRAVLRHMLLRYLDLVKKYAPPRDQTKRMRGILASLVRSLRNARSVRAALCTCTEWDGLYTIIEHIGDDE